MNEVDVMNGKKKKTDKNSKNGFEPLLITAITVFRVHITGISFKRMQNQTDKETSSSWPFS